MKRNSSQFNIRNLETLIPRFYRTIEQVYGFKIEKEHYLRTNDTRHIAFVSLMMQGYSPVEIARLGDTKQSKRNYITVIIKSTGWIVKCLS